ncbi:unnamed protein product [Lampetra planeri]
MVPVIVPVIVPDRTRHNLPSTWRGAAPRRRRTGAAVRCEASPAGGQGTDSYRKTNARPGWTRYSGLNLAAL